MKDKKRLTERIAKLAATEKVLPGGREVAAGPDGSPLAAILREIDETVLPRKLSFRRGDGSLVVSAGNRRLFSVVSVEGPEAEAGQHVLGRSLTQPDVALLGRLRDTLVSALAGEGPIVVRTSPPGETIVDFAAGTSAAALASAWGVDLGSVAAEAAAGKLEGFLGSAPSLARAWITLNAGAVAETGGEETLVARLRAFADTADMAELDMLPDGDGSRFIAIGRAPGDGDCLVFVSERSDAALLLIPAEALDNAKQSWRDAVG